MARLRVDRERRVNVASHSNAWGFAYGGMYNPPPGTVNGVIPTTDFDPVGVAYAGLLPKANITPGSGNGWNNYQYRVEHSPEPLGSDWQN